ncbi:MAG: hypothetical protein WBN40_03045 [Pseudomonadales bacterium]
MPDKRSYSARQLRLCALLACFGVLASAAFLLLGITPVLPSQRSWLELWNVGHLLLFFFIALSSCALSATLLKNFRLVPLFAIVGIAALLVGGALEYLQGFFGREPSLQDVALNVIGALVGCCTFVLIMRNYFSDRITAVPLRMLVAVLGILTCAAALALMPLWKAIADERLAARQFPILAAYNSRLELGRHSANIATQFQKGKLLAHFRSRGYSHVNWKHLRRDWSGYRELAIELDNLSAHALVITCRVHDRKHEDNYQFTDRFNRSFTLHAGRQTLLIDLDTVRTAPQKRAMDMADIAGLICFTSGQTESRSVAFEQIRLQAPRQ